MRLKYGKSARRGENPEYYDVVAKDKVHVFVTILGYLKDRLGSWNKAWIAIGLSRSFEPKLMDEQHLSIRNGNKMLRAYKAEKLKEKREIWISNTGVNGQESNRS